MSYIICSTFIVELSIKDLEPLRITKNTHGSSHILILNNNMLVMQNYNTIYGFDRRLMSEMCEL